MDPPRQNPGASVTGAGGGPLRALNGAEMRVLEKISQQVKEIAIARGLGELAGQVPLGDGCAPGQVAAFLERFREVPGRLEQLCGVQPSGERKVKVNGRLPLGQAAQTHTEDKDDSLTVLWLAPSALLPGQGAAALTGHALTVIHEVTHSLDPDDGFPVKDYAYQDSWAYGLLPPGAAICNADSYRHLAGLTTGEPWAYAPWSPVPRQREVLGKAGVPNLCNALALANVVLDRAWIRIMDCESFAAKEGGGMITLWWQADADPALDPQARLRAIEGLLRARKIVGERGALDLGLKVGTLSDSDRANIHNIYLLLTTAKSVMSTMTIVLAEQGQTLYDRNSARLTIPYGSVGKDAAPLAEEILAAVSFTETEQQPGAKGTPTALRNIIDDRVSLMLMLCDWDRLDAQPRVDAIRNALTQRTASPVSSPAGLASANTELALAALDYRADYWRQTCWELDKGIRLPRQASGPAGSLQDGYAATCNALDYLDALPLTGPQQEHRGSTVKVIARYLRQVLHVTPEEHLTLRHNDKFAVSRQS